MTYFYYEPATEKYYTYEPSPAVWTDYYETPSVELYTYEPFTQSYNVETS
jgi:hypothetical protein